MSDLIDRLSEGPAPKEYVPPPARLSPWRRLLAWLPGFCGYCGRRYVRCSDPTVGPFTPLVSHGRCCTDSHEGYIDRFNVFAGPVREWTDNVMARSSSENNDP
jgi:hypothetical protein